MRHPNLRDMLSFAIVSYFLVVLLATKFEGARKSAPVDDKASDRSEEMDEMA